MAKKQQLTKEQQREAYKNDWIMRNCNRFTKFLTCPVQIKLINDLKQKAKLCLQ